MKRTILTLFILSFAALTGSAQIITTYAGNGTGGYTGDGGPAILAEIGDPSGVATDNYGNVYVSFYNCIRKVSSSGIISTIAGTNLCGFSGDGGPATNAQINYPCGIAVDNMGNIYFGDLRNNRVRKIDNTGIIVTIAGTGDTANNGDGGAATSAAVFHPGYLAINSSGELVFTCIDFVRKIDDSGIITTIAGIGGLGYSGDGGPATAAQINANGLAIDAAGNVYISDSYYAVVRKVNSAGIISTIAGNGTSGFSGDGGPATTAQLGEPEGLCIDAIGNLFICDESDGRIRRVDASGEISTFAGGGSCAAGLGDGGPATGGCLSRPNDVKVDDDGNLFIADGLDARVRKVSGSTLVATVTNQGTSILVYPNPSQGTFIVNISSNTKESVYFFITNIVGVTVEEINSVTNQNIDLCLDVPPGLYFLSAATEHGDCSSKIIIDP